jgi:hypothetical protein
MPLFCLRKFVRNTKISTDIFTIGLGLVLGMSAIYGVINYILLSNINEKINVQLQSLLQQQNRFLTFNTDMLSQTIDRKMRNIQDMARTYGHMALYTSTFDNFKISSGVVGCADLPFTAINSYPPRDLKINKVQQHYVGSGKFQTGFVSSTALLLDVQTKASLQSFMSNNLDLMDWSLGVVGEHDTGIVFGHLVVYLFLKQGYKSGDPLNYHGVYGLLPGSCANVEFYKPKVGKILFDQSLY